MHQAGTVHFWSETNKAIRTTKRSKINVKQTIAEKWQPRADDRYFWKRNPATDGPGHVRKPSAADQDEGANVGQRTLCDGNSFFSTHANNRAALPSRQICLIRKN